MATKRKGLGAVTPRSKKKADGAAYRAGGNRRLNLAFHSSVSRAVAGTPKADRYFAVVCPASKPPRNLNTSARRYNRCGQGHGPTPTAAVKRALHQAARKLR